ncbi:MAG TPA: hypothetical protein VMV77_03755 [Bacteroidales bacterium]|nr:hypothetical protein [Bacteroidales bacterium]
MEDISVLQRADINIDRKVRTGINGSKPTPERTLPNPIIDNMIAEGGESFINYLDWHGLANEQNMLVLSSRLHYYYDHEDLKGVTTLINMKKLNLIKHLDVFFKSIYNVLPPKTNFIGCFSDSKTQTGVSITSRIYKKFINFLDSKIDVEIDKRDISRLLRSQGFKIVDMTEINGLTYFRTQNISRSVE